MTTWGGGLTSERSTDDWIRLRELPGASRYRPLVLALCALVHGPDYTDADNCPKFGCGLGPDHHGTRLSLKPRLSSEGWNPVRRTFRILERTGSQPSLGRRSFQMRKSLAQGAYAPRFAQKSLNRVP